MISKQVWWNEWLKSIHSKFRSQSTKRDKPGISRYCVNIGNPRLKIIWHVVCMTSFMTLSFICYWKYTNLWHPWQLCNHRFQIVRDVRQNLPCKYEGVSWKARMRVKKSDEVIDACELDPWGSLAGKSCLLGKFQASKRHCLKKQGGSKRDRRKRMEWDLQNWLSYLRSWQKANLKRCKKKEKHY